MKFNFKKIMSVIGGVFLVGSTLGFANAMYPTPFVKDNVANFAVVYGSNSATTDLTAANKINNHLLSLLDNNSISETQNNFSESLGITEDEVVLGTNIVTNGKLNAILTDNKIPTLLDEKIRWDDGESSKTSFNIHEEILIGDMELKTTLDDIDLKGVALTNDKALSYKYIFDDTLDIDRIGDEDADDLNIDILGKEYILEEVDGNSITISTSTKNVLSVGDTIVVDGMTLTIDDIFEDAVQINGEIVREDKTRKVNGIKVQVEMIAYHSSDDLPSKVLIRAGKELKTTYTNGDSYIGEDDSDPNWVWIIDNPGLEGGYIGVQYNQRILDDNDGIVYVGESYDFPENYATVQFTSLTDVDYGKFEVSFDDSMNLYFNEQDNNTKMYEDAKVIVLSGPKEESFEINGKETDEIYLKYGTGLTLVSDAWNEIVEHSAVYENQTISYPAWNETGYYYGIGGSPNKTDCENDGGTFYWVSPGTSLCEFPGYSVTEEVLVTPAWNETIEHSAVYEENPIVEVFFNDVNQDYSSSERPRYIGSFEANGSHDIATLFFDDTEETIKFELDNVSRVLTIGDIAITMNPTGDFEYLGNDDEESEDFELSVEGVDIGEKDEDILTHYGVKIENPDSNSENDRVTLEIPSEQVFAEISILGKGEEVTTEIPQIGAIIIKDTEIDSYKNKNLVVVGGSCINSVAAKLVGGSYCGEEWTAVTNVKAGQSLVEEYTSPYNSDKVALLIAGYNAEDTVSAVESLIQ